MVSWSTARSIQPAFEATGDDDVDVHRLLQPAQRGGFVTFGKQRRHRPTNIWQHHGFRLQFNERDGMRQKVRFGQCGRMRALRDSRFRGNDGELVAGMTGSSSREWRGALRWDDADPLRENDGPLCSQEPVSNLELRVSYRSPPSLSISSPSSSAGTSGPFTSAVLGRIAAPPCEARNVFAPFNSPNVA